MRFLRCRSHAVTMAHRSGACLTPWTVLLPHRPSGFQRFLQFDRQVIFSPAFLPCRGWQTHSVLHFPKNLYKKTRKEAASNTVILFVSSFFSVIQFLLCRDRHVFFLFSFSVRLRGRMGALCPYPSLFLPNLLRPNLLRPKYSLIVTCREPSV